VVAVGLWLLLLGAVPAADAGERTDFYEDRDLELLAREPEYGDSLESRLERVAETLAKIDESVGAVKRSLDCLEKRSGVIERSVDRLDVYLGSWTEPTTPSRRCDRPSAHCQRVSPSLCLPSSV
jgi:hypothetical protein